MLFFNYVGEQSGDQFGDNFGDHFGDHFFPSQFGIGLQFDEVTPNFQNECAKDSHPPNEQADCKELFAGVEKPPDKGLLDAGISSLISLLALGPSNLGLRSGAGLENPDLVSRFFLGIKGALNSSSNFDWVSRF